MSRKVTWWLAGPAVVLALVFGSSLEAPGQESPDDPPPRSASSGGEAANAVAPVKESIDPGFFDRIERQRRDREPPWRRRWRLMFEERAYPFGEIPPGAYRRAREYRATMPIGWGPEAAAQSSAQTVPGDLWVNIGPAPIHAKRNNNRYSGRVLTIAPTGGSRIYLGAAQGGVWTTDDGGNHWTPLTDGAPSLAISSIAIDPEDSRVIYAATGEQGGGIYGAGVLKSIDGGRIWKQMGARHFDNATTSAGGTQIARLVLDPEPVSLPREERIVYVAASNGLWRSSDAAVSWTRIMDGLFTDVVIDPTDSRRLYAARMTDPGRGLYRIEYTGTGAKPTITKLDDPNGILPRARFSTTRLTMVDQGGTPVLFASMQDRAYGRDLKGIWKTSDGGTTWTRVTGHPRHFADGEFTTPDLTELEPNDSPLYADGMQPSEVAQGTISSPGDVDYFRFTLTGNDALNVEICADRAGTGLDSRLCLYDANGDPVMFPDRNGEPAPYCVDNVLPHPDGRKEGSKDGRLLTGWKSIPAGTYYVSVEGVNGTTGNYQLSVIGIDLNCQCGYDQVLTVDPGDPQVMYMGLISLFRSTDGGRNWTEILDQGAAGVVHADIHAIEIDPEDPYTIYVGSDGGIWKSTDRGDTWTSLNTDLSITQPYQGISQHPSDPDFMLIGNQDNGVVRYQDGSWDEVLVGDGAATAIVNRDLWYGATQNQDFCKYTAIPKPRLRQATDGLETDGAAFTAPVAMHPTDSDVLIAGGGEKDAAGTLHYRVYRTDDQANKWRRNSPDLGDVVRALAFAPSNGDVYYALTRGLGSGVLWKTTDAGKNWTDLPWNGMPARRPTDVAVNPWNPDLVYVTFSGFYSAHVFRSARSGETGPWVAIDRAPYSDPAAQLPDVPVNAILIDPNFEDTLFVGTDLGIYRTTDDGRHWERFDHGLPNVAVVDLILDAGTGPAGKLRAATHGRGIWELRPGNDLCESREVITDGEYTGTTRGASPEGSTSCGPSEQSPDVWYEYTATCDGDLHVETCGSDFDTIVSIHTPICPGTAQTEFACRDDCDIPPCDGPRSCLTMPVTKNITYLLRIAGYGSAYGDYMLDVSCKVPNDDCQEASPIRPGSSADGSTRGATADLAPTCDGVPDDGPGVWYTVVGTGNTLTASLCTGSGDYDGRLTVYCGGCDTKRCIAAADDTCGSLPEVSWCSAPGVIYDILVHDGSGYSDGFQLAVSDDGIDCGPFYLYCGPGNDQCSQPAPLEAPGADGDSSDADTDGVASCVQSNSDVWYDYAAACHGFSTFDTCSAGGTLDDTVLSVHDACYGRELRCNDDGGTCGLKSEVTVPHVAGQAMRVRVAGYGAGPTQGTFHVNVAESTTTLVAPEPDLYVADGSGFYEDYLFRVDPEDQSSAVVAQLQRQEIAAMTYAPGLGLMYGSDDAAGSDEIVTIDLQTGATTLVGPVGFTAVRGLAFDPDRLVLYGVDVATGQLIDIDPYTGAGTAIGPIGFADVEALAFDPASGTLYGSDIDTDQLITIDTGTGAGTAVGPFGAGFDRIEGLAFDTVRGTLYGFHNVDTQGDGWLVAIDVTTGAARQIGTTFNDFGPNALAYVPGLRSGTIGQPYEETAPVSGGCPEYTFSNPAGLPPGLSMDSSGKITGTPEAVGKFVVSFDVTDTDPAGPTVSARMPLRVRPANDMCADAPWIAEGPTDFSNVLATSDGPDDPETCTFSGDSQIRSDIWYCHRATCTGDMTVSLCGAGYDSKLAVYEGCGCPARAPAAACNDDSCGLQSEVTLPVEAGSEYLIRIGGYDGAQGSGTLDISCAGTPSGACCRDHVCSIDLEETCLDQGGTYFGDGSTCGPDSDGDGAIDDCDGCPADREKVEPGVCGCGTRDTDTDGDGLLDCVDDDLDGDGVPDATDTFPTDPRRCGDRDADGCDDCSSSYIDLSGDGTDQDADGICSEADCDETDPNTYPDAPETNDGLDNQCPGDPGYGVVDEVSGNAGFHNPADKTEYSWPPQAGATEYEVARSDSPDFGVCDRFVTQTNVWHDPDVPSPGFVWFYLVRATAPNPGSWGQDSAGLERTGCP